MRQHQRRAAEFLDHLGHGEGLARAGDAQQNLVLFVLVDAPLERGDRGLLIAARAIVHAKLKLHLSSIGSLVSSRGKPTVMKTLKPIRYPFFLTAALCLSAGTLALPQAAPTPAQHPRLNGRWELDAGNSSLGSMPKMEKYVEVIEEDYPRLIITTYEKPPGKPENHISVQYSLDGREVSTEIGNSTYKSKSKWVGEKLMTLITPPQGDQMIEMRYLSKDKKSQAVDLYFKEAGGNKKPDQERIMQYRGAK